MISTKQGVFLSWKDSFDIKKISNLTLQCTLVLAFSDWETGSCYYINTSDKNGISISWVQVNSEKDCYWMKAGSGNKEKEWKVKSKIADKWETGKEIWLSNKQETSLQERRRNV